MYGKNQSDLWEDYVFSEMENLSDYETTGNIYFGICFTIIRS
jgi:hypothetical protein